MFWQENNGACAKVLMRLRLGFNEEAISCEILVFVSLCVFVVRFFVGSSLSGLRY